jgi:hypothetical protein
VSSNKASHGKWLTEVVANESLGAKSSERLSSYLVIQVRVLEREPCHLRVPPSESFPFKISGHLHQQGDRNGFSAAFATGSQMSSASAPRAACRQQFTIIGYRDWQTDETA